MRTRLASVWLLLAMLLGAAGYVSPANATRVMQFSLDQVVAQADIAFVGSCISRIEESTEVGLPSTRYVFEVQRALKGVEGATVEVRVLGTGAGTSEGLRLPGGAQWSPGQPVLLFLNAPSELGFSSAVGLHQGDFLLVEGPVGLSVQVSPLLLTETIAMSRLTPTEWEALKGALVPIETFLTIVETLMRATGQSP